ncbi:MAG: alpha/beta fold hydrolase [Alphaproteobacteria bacterium]|nr:alpha/beta fold hydrolase [Alphaproteobacteria bacterium]
MFFENNGVRIFYRWDGEGLPLTLIHGVGGGHDAWDPIVADLKDEFRILRLDLRGHGQSDKVPGAYTVWDFVSDVKALLDHVGLKKTRLGGFSLGGLISQAFALKHQDYLERLAIMAAVAGRTPEEFAKVRERLAHLAAKGPLGHFEASVDRWFTPAFRTAHPEVIARRREHAARMDPECYVAAYAVLADTDFADRLHEVKVPTLVATGEFDVGSNVRMATIMHKAIQGSKLHIWPGLKHSMLFEAPGEVSKTLREFMRG